MVTATATLEDLLVIEDWDLARQVIITSPLFDEERAAIEEELEIDLGSLGTIIDLPEASLKKLKKRLLRTINAKLQALRKDLYQKICSEFDYCKKKKELGFRTAEYIAAALDIWFGAGAFALAGLLIKTEFLDKLCRCKP